MRSSSLLLFPICFLICASSYSNAQTPYYHTETYYRKPNSEPREHPLDIKRMTLDVRFDAPAGKVFGRVTHVFQPLRITDSVVFDAIKLNIKAVACNGAPVRYISRDSSLIVFTEGKTALGRRDSIEIVYETTPRKGIYFIGWNTAIKQPKVKGFFNIRKQIWTQGQAYDNREWIPMYDAQNDKYITETIVTFDAKYNVLSNGIKISEKVNNDGTKTWHYTMTKPHAGYLLMLAVGEFAIDARKSESGVPIDLWYYPDYPERVKPTYRYSTEIVDFLEQEIGVPWPWDKYSQVFVQDYIFGAMENTTATIFGDFFAVDERGYLDRNYINVNCHETTHDWFGDMITQRDDKNIWLHESYATFYPKLFSRKYFGEDTYQWMRRGEQNQALVASEKDRLPIVHPDAGGTRIYPKGSAVIDMMRYVYGEDEFRSVIKYYLKKHAYSNVETNDLYQAFQDTLGVSPGWFFNEWLYRGGEPHYTVSWREISENGKEYILVSVRQTHLRDALTGLFKMPVVIEVYGDNGLQASERVWIEDELTEIKLPKQGTPSFVLFDPGSWIIKKMTFKKPFAELKAQALGSPLMIDRYDAVAMLKDDSSNTSEKERLFLQLFDREKFYAVKNEIIRQIAGNTTETARIIMRKAFADKDVEIRKAALDAIKGVPAEYKLEVERLLLDSSYQIVTTALDKLCEAFPSDAPRYLSQTADETGLSAQVFIKWHEIGALRGDKQSFGVLADLAGNAYEFRTRQNAFNSLKKVNYCDENVAENLFDAMLNPNTRLAAAAKSLLDYFYEQTQFRQIIKRKYAGTDWTKAQKDLLESSIK
ncbi:hypothetical protein MASR2M18_01590 [Ignavibacteria bacterium]|nr:hypothetical protein [Bacteroidota bacterium]MCZ2132770.1 hypothetical protein [Bacteroidota bacterium]